MVTVEIILILIGVVFLIGSFFVKDKLSQKDVEKIAELSEDEINIIVEKQLNKAEGIIEDKIDEKIDEAQEKTVRAMEKESNEKIMSISEYSDTVLESMNKTHNEIMFLYSMLNDKHKDLSDFANSLQKISDKISNFEKVEEKIDKFEKEDKKADKKADIVNELHDINTINVVNAIDDNSDDDANEAFATYVTEQREKKRSIINNNDNILRLHKQGIDDVEIAKQLGLGLGEVKLVIGLYKGENTDEI